MKQFTGLLDKYFKVFINLEYDLSEYFLIESDQKIRETLAIQIRSIIKLGYIPEPGDYIKLKEEIESYSILEITKITQTINAENKIDEFNISVYIDT